MPSRRIVGYRRWVAMRAAQTVPVFFAILIINFLIIHLAPGNPADRFVGEMASPEVIAAVRNRFGLDRPLHEQLAVYIYNILRGEFGYSFYYQEPVFDVIGSAVPNTLILMSAAVTLSSLLGVLLGVLSSRRPYSLVDNATTLFALTGYSLPVFWLGQMLMLIFAVWLGMFPSQGMYSLRVKLTGLSGALDIMYHMALPTVVLVVWQLALVTRITRSSMLEVFREDYILTARSKGLAERTVVFKHVLRNALLPVVTVIGTNVQMMFAGAVLTETVFAWPGLGRLFFGAIYARDYPLIMGMFVVISMAVIVTNLVVDLLYGYLDPRIRYVT